MDVVYHEELSALPQIVGPVHEKQFIAIHWYGDPRTAGDVHGTAHYLAGVAHASVNYVAGDGHVYCLVNPTQIAYGQGDGGNGYGNQNGISIECDPRMKDVDLETVAHLIAKIRADFGVNFPLRPHNDFTATQCPGVWEAMIPWLDERANQIMQGVDAAPHIPNAPAPDESTPYVPNDHWKVEKGESLSQVANHFGSTVQAVATFNGIKDVNVIHVGERIWSPKAGRDTWTVDPGDTLASICRTYKKNWGMDVTVQQLQWANGINDPSTEVKVGMRLLIP